MKKLSVFLLTLLAVLGLAACNKTQEPETQEEEKSEEKSEQQEEQVDPNISYHVVGGYFDDWNNYSEDNKMTNITKEDLATLNKGVADQLADKEIVALLKYEGRVFNVGPTWTANAVVDGETVAMNGGYTIKVVRAKYDEEDDNTFADQWNPDPKTSCVANYTPDTLFMPKWVETAVEGEEGLGTWADNPVVIGGAGEYTVIFVEYKGANTADSPKYGMALIKTKELEEPKTTAELIEEEHAALVDGTVTEATLFEDVKATVKAVAAEDNADGGKDVKVVLELDGVLFALTFNAEDTTGLEAGKEVTFSGKIDASAAAVAVGDYNVEIVFANAEASWPKVGAPAGIYVKGSMNEWSDNADYELKFNEAGHPEITLPLEAGSEFKVANTDWTTVNLGYVDTLPAAFADKGGNIEVVTTGMYTITVVDGALQVAAGRTGIYLKGSLNGWANTAEYELRYNAENTPEIEVTLEAGAEFKVADADWSVVNLGYHAELPAAFADKGGNIEVVTAGTYVVQVLVDVTGDAPTYKLVVTAK